MDRTFVLFLCVMMGTALLNGCSSLEEKAREQMEWTEKNHARTDGKSAQEVLDDTIGDIIGNPDYSSQSTADTNTTSKQYGIGDTVKMKNDTTKIEVTLTDWGTVYDSLSNRILMYVSYSVANTGNDSIYVSNSMFNVYADDFSVEQAYYNDDIPSDADLSPGRKLSGRFYAKTNPEYAYNIEVECGDVVFVLKDVKMNQTPADTAALENYLDFSTDADTMGKTLQRAGFDFVIDGSGYYRAADESVWLYNTDLGGSEIVIMPSDDNAYSLFGVSCGMDVEDAFAALAEQGAVNISSPEDIRMRTQSYTLYDSYTITLSFDYTIDGIDFYCFILQDY